jgi:hypothetical protein
MILQVLAKLSKIIDGKIRQDGLAKYFKIDQDDCLARWSKKEQDVPR